MLKWISEIASPRSQSMDDPRKDLGDQDDALMVDLVVTEVENQVQEFELLQERRKSEVATKTRVPDYSWLVSNLDTKPKKYLTMQERARVESACERMQPSEWSNLINMWKSRSNDIESRQQIFDIFLSCVHEVIASRPRESTVSDVLKRYIRSGSSINAVSDSPRGPPPRNPFGSSRSLAEISLRDLTDIV